VSNSAEESSRPFVRLLDQNQTALYAPDDEGEVDEFDEEMLTPITHGIEDQAEKIKAILDQKVSEAVENGLSAEGKKQLRDMLSKYRDVFRTEFTNDPPIAHGSEDKGRRDSCNVPLKTIPAAPSEVFGRAYGRIRVAWTS
jgi:hypothetical protein